MKDESLENTIITLHGQGWSIRRISSELFISRRRIRRLLVSNSLLRDTTSGDKITPQKKRTSKLDPYKEFIAELLDKYSNITGRRVYEHLREKGYDGKITIVRDYLTSIRGWVQKRRCSWWKRTRVSEVPTTGVITISRLPLLVKLSR